MKVNTTLLGAACCAVLAATAASAATGSVERVLFEDVHIRFVEVLNSPGSQAAAAIPYHSIIMTDAAWPDVKEAATNAKDSASITRSLTSRPGNKNPYPWCQVQGPLPARTVTVTGNFPQHYYRLDYKRIDGTDYGKHWREWYKDVFGPPKKVVPDLGRSLLNGKPYSKEWPFDFRYNAEDAAPANHNIRYRDDHVELIEVALREGETEHMHGHPYYSVFADDGGFWPAGAEYSNLDLGTEKSFDSFGEFTTPRDAPVFPKCVASTPQAVHSVTVVKGPPQHFYRVHFKHLQGDRARTEWRTLYSTLR